MGAARFADLIACLKGDETPRVPSLIVTVFGDLAQGEQDVIGAPVLGQLMDLIGVKPEAMRVALHRLRKDGWISGQRNGRSSDYRLTERGRAESIAASPRIYNSTPATDTVWLVVVDPARSGGVEPGAGVWVSQNVLITGERGAASQGFAIALDAGAELPEWMTRKVCDPELAEMSARFAASLEQTLSKLTPGLDPLEIAALRVLVVHGWRRIALKTPPLPDHVFPDRWAGPACRAAMTDVLARLTKPTLRDLAANAAA
jgi:phenylacetic acid degradation operon negative regulatory protein